MLAFMCTYNDEVLVPKRHKNDSNLAIYDFASQNDIFGVKIHVLEEHTHICAGLRVGQKILHNSWVSNHNLTESTI